MQYIKEIEKKRENYWSGCNNAKGKNNIGLRMVRKTKNELIRIIKAKISFI